MLVCFLSAQNIYNLVDQSLGAFNYSRPKPFPKISVVDTQTHGCGEEMQLSSGWTLIGSELYSPSSSVRTKRSLAIRYPNVVIKPPCGKFDICLNH